MTEKEIKKIKPGTKVSVTDAPMYTIHCSKTPSLYMSGAFFIYDNKIRNERIRLCDEESKVEKPCMRLGWFNLKDITIESK